MSIQLEIWINQLAQGIKPLKFAQEEFSKFPKTKQIYILRKIVFMILQSEVRQSDAHLAINNSFLKYTFTPCILLSKGNLKEQLAKILTLPQTEHTKSFVLLINLLNVSDSRRRATKCVNGCNHWWHKDLSDKTIVQEIIKNAE